MRIVGLAKNSLKFLIDFLMRPGLSFCTHRDHCEPRPLDDVVVVCVVVAVPAGRVHVGAGHHGPDGRLHHGQPPPDGVIQSEVGNDDDALAREKLQVGCLSNSV